ncbi:MAG: hypothetical protein FJX53_05845 [Alphaproteobacteria bacterium]|nr:hypothetical protein [Alphaproteobacteria bacterium]
MLYEIGPEDADYILSTFPIVRREDENRFGRYLTRDLILAYMRVFAAGDSESRVTAEPAYLYTPPDSGSLADPGRID